MLTRVEISNFQSHKHTVLEFIPGTNVIIGGTDTGKSALFRAINWVCSNRPLGDAYRSEWGGDTRVVLHTAEGNTIERFRSATKNEYVVNGKILAAFGSEVPQEVEQLLGVDHANIQTQMDPPFLLSATPGEAARMLNKAASIDDIDYAMSGLKRSHGKIASGIKYSEDQYISYKEQLSQYADLPAIEKEVLKAERLEKLQNEKAAAIASLKQMMYRAHVVQEQLAGTAHIPLLLKQLGSTEAFYSSYRGRLSQYQKLSAVVSRVKDLQERLDSTEYVEQGMADLGEAEKLISKLKEKGRHVEELKRLEAKGSALSDHIDQVQNTIDELEREFHELAPEYCPLCGAEWEGQ